MAFATWGAIRFWRFRRKWQRSAINTGPLIPRCSDDKKEIEFCAREEIELGTAINVVTLSAANMTYALA